MRAVDLIRFNRWGRVADPYKTLSTYGLREESTKTVVVVTDGESRYCPRTSEAIRVVKRQGLKVFAIGVGSNTKRSVLESVASSPSYQFAFISRNFDSPRCVKIILAWTRPTCKVIRSIETTSLTNVYPKYTRVILFRTSTSASTFSKLTKNNVFKTTKIPLEVSTSKPLTKVTSKGPRVNDTTSLTRVYPKYTTITPFRTSSRASTFEKITKSKNNVDESTTSYKLLSTTAFTEVTSTETTEDERNTFAIVTKSKVDETTTSFETPSTAAFTEVTSSNTTEDERNTFAIVTKSKVDETTTSFETPLTTAFTEVTSSNTTEDERNTFAIVTKSKVDETTTSFETPSTTAFTEVTSTETTEDERNTFAIVTKSKVDETTTSFETPSTTAFTEVTSSNTTEDERNTFAIVTKSKVDETTTSFETPSTAAFTEVTSSNTTEDERNTFAIVTKVKVDETTTSFETPSTTSLTKVTSTDKTKVIETTSEDYFYVEPN
ncbi:collagen alpha-4(VI) chain [Biomphalaria glabrata]|nr:collagen alpha-4(VI) chain-like [Biomphalaria glabrata]